MSSESMAFGPETFEALLARHRSSGLHDRARRWLLLEVAHVVGQTRFIEHLKVHALMFDLARQEGDWAEMAGQLLRLALVPVGHALGHLPVGNPGRANVSAFAPMPVRDDIARVVGEVRLEAGSPPDPS